MNRVSGASGVMDSTVSRASPCCMRSVLTAGPSSAHVVALLGSEASITAIASGASVDTTMGPTPTDGAVMGTRSRDLDLGVLLHLPHERE